MTPDTDLTPSDKFTEHDIDEEIAGRSLRRRVVQEIVLVAAFYGLYTLTRDLNGSAHVSTQHALNNAKTIIHWEKLMFIFHEETIQHWFIGQHWLLWVCDVFYGSAHFIVTIGVLVWIFVTFPAEYRFWRNALAVTTGIALVGFITYPLMPPRLLPLYGLHYKFVDTLETIGGLWSFDTIKDVSNQYAAMPSLHIGWSLWCAASLFTLSQKTWVRAIGIFYPVSVLFCIVVTANHYFLDAVGGAIIFGIGALVATLIERTQKPRALEPSAQPSTAD
jgi:uncharacterized membrane protein